jgi:hypothetical protein
MFLFGIFLNHKIDDIKKYIIDKYEYRNLSKEIIAEKLYLHTNSNFTFYSIRMNNLFGNKISEDIKHIYFLDGYVIDINKQKFIDNVDNFNLDDLEHYHGEYTYIKINKYNNTLKIIKPIMNNNVLFISKNILNSQTTLISNQIVFHSLLADIKEPDNFFISNMILYTTPICFPKTQYKNIELISPFAKISIDKTELLICDPKIEILKDNTISIDKTIMIINKIYDIILNYCYLKNIEQNFFLTGGKDSRLVFSILNKLDAFNKYNINLITRGAPYSGDVVVAKKISNKYNIKHELIDPTNIYNRSSYYSGFKSRIYGTNLFVSSKDNLSINFRYETPKKINFYNHEYCTKEKKDIKMVEKYFNIENTKLYVNKNLRVENINYGKNILIKYILEKSNVENGNLIFKILNRYQYWCVSHSRNNCYLNGFFPNILVFDIIMKLLYNCYTSDELEKYNKFHTNIIKKNSNWLFECPLFNDTWGSANKNDFKLSLPNSISLQNHTLLCLDNSRSLFVDIVNKNKNILENIYNTNELIKVFQNKNFYSYQHHYYIFLQVLAHKIINFDLSKLKHKSTYDLIGDCMKNDKQIDEKINNEKVNEEVYNKILNVMIKLIDKKYDINSVANQLKKIAETDKINELYKKNIMKLREYLKYEKG